MAKRKSKAVDIKKIAFRNRGPKLTRQRLESLPVWLPDDYKDFLLLHNGGTPVNGSFRYPFEGTETISTIDFFYAVRAKPNRYRFDNLIYDGFLHYRNDLPRLSIPIARVDEDSFVLLFEAGPYRDGVWYYIWLHDDPGCDETEGAIAKIADSIPEFLGMLRPYFDFYSFVSYVVPPDISLAAIKKATAFMRTKWVEYNNDSHGKYACCLWDLLEDRSLLSTELFLVDNDSIPSTHWAGLKLPKLRAPKQTRVLHLVVSSTYKDIAIKKMPKKIGDWKLIPIEDGA